MQAYLYVSLTSFVQSRLNSGIRSWVKYVYLILNHLTVGSKVSERSSLSFFNPSTKTHYYLIFGEVDIRYRTISCLRRVIACCLGIYVVIIMTTCKRSRSRDSVFVISTKFEFYYAGCWHRNLFIYNFDSVLARARNPNCDWNCAKDLSFKWEMKITFDFIQTYDIWGVFSSPGFYSICKALSWCSFVIFTPQGVFRNRRITENSNT